MKTLCICLGFVLLFVAMTTAPAALAAPAADTFQWTGEYFNNITLSGAPVLRRGDPEINFSWAEYTSPAPGVVGNSHYSVRWTRQVYFNTSGNWVFTTVNDDGMRVWVDNRITTDWWYDQGPTTHTGTIYLTAGSHTVRVEYYNRVLGGTARVSWALEGAIVSWRGEYFSNQDLSGSPTLVRDDANVNFDWGTGSPDPSIPADHFSVRWTRNLYLNAGTWRFTTTADDGVRLWVDGRLVIDKWFDQSATSYTADVGLSSGSHTVQMEYYDNHVNGLARLSYTPINLPPPPAGAWRGQYFNNISLSGSPVFVRDDASLHFIWNTASPGPGVPADYFSAMWDSVQVLPVTGNYSVIVSSDDGVRVWIDGALVIDAWYDHPATLYTATWYLRAGAHNVHVEYYERTVNAMVGVDIVPQR